MGAYSTKFYSIHTQHIIAIIKQTRYSNQNKDIYTYYKKDSHVNNVTSMQCTLIYNITKTPITPMP